MSGSHPLITSPRRADNLSLSPRRCKVGTDWLRISLCQYEIDADHPFRIIPAEHTTPAALFQSGDTVYWGVCAALRQPGFSARIFRPAGAPASLFQIRIEAACQLDGINFPLADESELLRALANLEGDLADLGIYTDLGRAKMSQLEVGQDMEISGPPEAYLEVIADRRAPFRARRYSQGNWRCWSNRERSLAVYDKSQEMRRRGRDPGQSILRFETRLKTPRSVHIRAGLKTVSELRQKGISEARDHHLRLVGRLLK